MGLSVPYPGWMFGSPGAFLQGFTPAISPSLACPAQNWCTPMCSHSITVAMATCRIWIMPHWEIPTPSPPAPSLLSQAQEVEKSNPQSRNVVGADEDEGTSPSPSPRGSRCPPGCDKREGNLRKEEARLGQPISQDARFPSGPNPAPPRSPRFPPVPGKGLFPRDGGDPGGRRGPWSIVFPFFPPTPIVFWLRISNLPPPSQAQRAVS